MDGVGTIFTLSGTLVLLAGGALLFLLFGIPLLESVATEMKEVPKEKLQLLYPPWAYWIVPALAIVFHIARTLLTTPDGTEVSMWPVFLAAMISSVIQIFYFLKLRKSADWEPSYRLRINQRLGISIAVTVFTALVLALVFR